MDKTPVFCVFEIMFSTKVLMRAECEAPRTSAISLGMSLSDKIPGTNRIVDVVIDIRNAVRRSHDLPLERLGDPRPCVSENRHAHLVGEIQSVAVALELIYHAKRLLIMVKRRSHHIRQRSLARVTERRVPQIVP